MWVYEPVHEEETDEWSAVWLLRDDTGGMLGQIEQFSDDAPFYGTCAFGRTGAMTTLDACKAKVERLIVKGIEGGANRPSKEDGGER